MKKNHLLPLFLLFSMVANGQNTLQSYITEPAKFNKSLLQNTVSGLAKDEDGMLWAISQYGCYRYDGYNTKIYLTNNTPFLTSDRYRALFNDNDKKRLIVIGDNDYYFIRDRRLKEKSNADSVAISSNYNFLLVPKSKTHQLINQNQTLCKASILFFKTDTILLADKISLNFSKNRILPENLLNARDKENLISKNGQVFTLNKTGLVELFWNGEKTIVKAKKPHSWIHSYYSF